MRFVQKKSVKFNACFVAAFATAAFPITAPRAGWAQTPTPPAPTVPPATGRPAPPERGEPYAATETPDYAGAVWEPASPFNFQRSDPAASRLVNCIVIHDIEGSAISAVRWFQNKQATASSHYVVSGDGTVYQLVKERDVAWHAGNRDINTRSVGIEHDGFAYRPGFYNPQEYEASARLVRTIALRYQIPRDRVHIFGHAEVPDPSDPTKFGGRSGHTDPGPYWDWDYFMALVRNDAAAVPAPPVAVKLHPGEKGQAVFSFTNTGDDLWPADAKPPRPNPDLRQAGPVYLGLANASTPAAGGPPPGWISPVFAASPDSGDVPPTQTARFVVPLVGGASAGTEQTQILRLWKVFPAPHVPVPFGPTVSVSVSTVPWDITAPLPPTPPIGWKEKTLPGTNERVFWRTTAAGASNAKPDPVSWSVSLPAAGSWEVYVRVPQGPNKVTGRPTAIYHVPTPTGSYYITAFYPKPVGQTGSGEWQKLGQYFFDVPKPGAAFASPGVRPGAPVPAPPVVQGTVSIIPLVNKTNDVLVFGDVRFVGPFAPPKPIILDGPFAPAKSTPAPNR